jgi:hypothetical protein
MKRIAAFVVWAMVLIGPCAAQSTNNAQRIIGAWVDNNTGQTWTFNANGTVSGTDEDGDGFNYKFGIADTKMAVSGDGDFAIFNISISPDGRTLILEETIQSPSASGLYLSNVYWFTKK